MSEHVFLQEGRVQEADINEILDLTAFGSLEWRKDPRYMAIGSSVTHSMGREVAVTRNLLTVRVGYNPDATASLNYLRLRDKNEEAFYVDKESEQGLVQLATRLLRVGEIACRTRDGRIHAKAEFCSDCGRETGHMTLYEAPHGLEGAIMAGSERVECVNCGHSRRLAAA